MAGQKTLRQMTGFMRDEREPEESVADQKAFERRAITRSNRGDAGFTRENANSESTTLRETEASRGGMKKMRDRATKGSPPFSAAELKKGYRKC